MTTEVLDRNDPKMSAASTLIPWPYEDQKGIYLGYRACGYGEREALNAISISLSTLRRWREVFPEFLDAEKRLPDIRKQLALEYIQIEALRNYRMLLDKDRRIIEKALNPRMIPLTTKNKDGTKTTISIPEPMSKADHEYLLRIRSQYTPQALAAIVQETGGSDGGGDFNWTKEVMRRMGKAGSEIRMREVTVKSDGQT